MEKKPAKPIIPKFKIGDVVMTNDGKQNIYARIVGATQSVKVAEAPPGEQPKPNPWLYTLEGVAGAYHEEQLTEPNAPAPPSRTASRYQ